MKDIEQEQALIRQYLLGELDEERKEQLEQRVMTERDFKQEVLIVEEELLDDYVSGALSARDEELLLKNYLSSPNQRRKIEVARALGRYTSIHKPSEPPQSADAGRLKAFLSMFRAGGRFGQFSWAAAVILIIAGAALLWWLLKAGQTDEIAKLNRPGSTILEPGRSVVSVDLSEILLRGKNPTPLAVNSEVKVVQLRIAADNGDSTYRAVLRDSAGKEIVHLDDLRPRKLASGPTIVIQLPIHLLSPADYELELTESGPGSKSVPRHYSFQVLKV